MAPYLVDLDGTGKATVKLQATLINEMIDLENVTANLVVGVPSFLFKGTIDPMALGQTVAQLTPSRFIVTLSSSSDRQRLLVFVGAETAFVAARRGNFVGDSNRCQRNLPGGLAPG